MLPLSACTDSLRDPSLCSSRFRRCSEAVICLRNTVVSAIAILHDIELCEFNGDIPTLTESHIIGLSMHGACCEVVNCPTVADRYA